jgi:hypothetical protein
LVGEARLSYALPCDKGVDDVMQQIWTQDETELPPYVPYAKDEAYPIYGPPSARSAASNSAADI